MPKRAFLSCIFACLTLAACSDDPQRPPSDTGLQPDASDASQPGDAADTADASDAGSEELARTPPQEGVSPDGHASVDQPVGAEEARVGKITSEETGFTGVWAHCRQGDFKLYNSLIEVCIQSETTNRFEVFAGGMIVDARRVGDERDEVLDFVMPLVNIGTTFAERVEVVRDGSDGGAAVLQVVSYDTALAHLIGLTGRSLVQPQDLEIITEYRLEPDSDVVEMVSFYKNPNDGQRTFFVGDWFGFGDRAQLFTPERGVGAPGGTYPWLASVARDRSYGWVTPSGTSRELGLSQQGLPWAASRAQNLRLSGGAERTWQRWFIVGDGTLASIRERAAELRGEAIDSERRTIVVQTDAGQPAEGREVLALKDDKAIDWGVTNADGEVTLLLADGAHDLVIDGWIGGEDFERTLDVSAQPHSVSIDTPATLSVEATEAESDEALTARIVLHGSGYSGVAVDGHLELRVAPGSYRLIASHGPEYDAAAVDVELEAGDVHAETLAVPRAFDTAGWLAGDFHQHMEPSLDSEVSLDDRLFENISVGVEVTATTDHEAVTDLRPLVAEHGFEDEFVSFPGVEISPIETHVGMYPMAYQPDEHGRGTLSLAVIDDDGEPRKRSIPELVDLARGLASDPVVQLNHSRRGTSGLLELVGFDPEAGPEAVDDERFTADFDTMEITNRFGDTCRLFADWSGFLNAGYRFTGLGNSDTHGLSGESGLPRNFLHTDKGPAELTEDDLRQVLRSGQVTVGAHAFIDFSDAMLPGDTISADEDDSVDFAVRVQTPAWAQATRLIAVVNGEVQATFERDDTSATEHLDFARTVPLTFERDSWVVFFSYGPQPSGDVQSGKPVLAFTNPVYVDVDGDVDDDSEAWEAPGVGALSLDAVNQFCN